jgi:hypothetical protein
MWIQIEFNPDLALRDISFFRNGTRKEEECIPENLQVGTIYNFLKLGQRNYYLLQNEPIPLLETQGNQILSRPLAAIRILEATHFFFDDQIWTKWQYQVLEVYDTWDPKIHFEGYLSVKS